MLTEEENRQLITLLGKLSWPVSVEVFNALCENFSVTPIELAVLREGGKGPEIFMIYRKDSYFDGWHFTGSIVVPGKTIDFVLNDILIREVGITIVNPQFEFVRFRQFMKGDGPGQTARGQEVSLLHVCHLPEGTDVSQDEERKFFPLTELPERIIANHSVMLEDVKEYLNKNIRT